jgi:diguanylate cyclase (GGDEF)-like protein/PAS domain S-box-containing protein
MNAQALRAAWTALIEGLLDAVWLVDAASLRIVAANAAAGVLLGVEASSLVSRTAAELSATPEDLAFWDGVADGWSGGVVSESLVRRFNGSVVPVTRRVNRVELDGVAVFVVVFQDRSAHQATQDELEHRLAELRATLESTADGILVTDLAGVIRGFNRRFAALWSLPEDLLTQRDDAAVQSWMRRSVVDVADYDRRLAAIQDATLLQTSDVFALHSGKVIERVTLPQCSRGQPIGRVFSFRDITEKLAASQRIEELSQTDPLTGLPNRSLLADRVEFALAMSQRNGHSFALMVVNLDRFKHINDTFGLGFGDRVLLEVTERIKGCLRSLDTVARLGSDEFVLLVHKADAAGAEATARRVIDAMSRPFLLDGVEFTVTCSIGVALSPVDGTNLDELIRRADAAMQRVKALGRASFRFHQPQDHAQPRSQMQLDHAMRRALVSGHFHLHYQPQVNIGNGQVIGVEALIRWRDPVLGSVPPAEFIPMAEESGFIIAIGDWVLTQAVSQAAEWYARGRAATAPARTRAHGVHPAARRRGCAAPAQGTRAAGRDDVDRRLRHGVFEPGLPEAVSHRPPEDRPQLRQPPAGRRQRRGHRQRHRAAGACDAAARHCRRRGDRAAAAVPAQRRLRRVPGVPVRAGPGGARPGASARLVDACSQAGREARQRLIVSAAPPAPRAFARQRTIRDVTHSRS